MFSISTKLFNFSKPTFLLHTLALVLSTFILSACSGSDSGSVSGAAPESPQELVSDNPNDAEATPLTVDDDTVEDNETQDVVTPSDDSNEVTTAPITPPSPITPPTPTTPRPPEIETITEATTETRVVFDIIVPDFVSNELQLQLRWGDKTINAAWLIDETWRATDIFPVDTGNRLSVTFFDGNGTLILGTYETDFRTGASPTHTLEIFPDQFETVQYDADGDGFSNLEESLSGTDPLAFTEPALPPSDLVSVFFGVTVLPVMSNSLQVKITWGDEEVLATWIGDESWTAVMDLPKDTQQPLNVLFSSGNGSIPLAYFSTTYRTGSNSAENIQYVSQRFNFYHFDDDLDGVSNYNEVRASTDPLVVDSLVPVTFTSVASSFIEQRCTRCHTDWVDSEVLFTDLMTRVSSQGINFVTPYIVEESSIVSELEGSLRNLGGPEMTELMRAWIRLGAFDN